ncbi:MAG: glutamine-hydrolyzing GMP synthase [Candidatus Ozemobacteraceae bacterium]
MKEIDPDHSKMKSVTRDPDRIVVRDRDRIVVIDFGGQYAHLVANRIRRLGVFAELAAPEAFDPADFPGLVGIVFSGGPHSVTEPGHPTIRFDPKNCPVPILGLCYGHQLLAQLFGGSVRAGTVREYGPATLRCDASGALFSGLPTEQSVWMSHGDSVERVPSDFRITASSGDLAVAAFESQDRRIFGFQFHPEVSHSTHGMEMLDRFVAICTGNRTWNPSCFRHELVQKIREETGNRHLLLLLSGGVDSLVALALCLEAVGGDRVFPLHVDTGLMRLRESDDIIQALAEAGFHGVKVTKAHKKFFEALQEVVEPERKREIIGRLFVEVLHDRLSELPDGFDWMLVQGTIYPDRIESGSGKHAAKIKTHHNRVKEIEELIHAGRVIEPLKDLYKDEVRELGKELGLPASLVSRRPFPGPGLGIRILCSDTDKPEPAFDREVPILRRLLSETKFSGTILPVRSVGVQGDSRTYLHPVALWNRNGEPPDWEALRKISLEIVNLLTTVNRVVFSPSTLEGGIRLTKSFVTPDRADRLRVIDDVTGSRTADLEEIWQLPVVSLPAVDSAGKAVFVLRPVRSRDAMTADFYPMAPVRFSELIDAIARVDPRACVLYDVTPKPPGTIEWE